MANVAQIANELSSTVSSNGFGVVDARRYVRSALRSLETTYMPNYTWQRRSKAIALESTVVDPADLVGWERLIKIDNVLVNGIEIKGYVSPNHLSEREKVRGGGAYGKITQWWQIGDKIEFNGALAVDDIFTVEFWALSDISDEASNWTTQLYSDVVLLKALSEALSVAGDTQAWVTQREAETHEKAYAEAVHALKYGNRTETFTKSNRSARTISVTVTDADMVPHKLSLASNRTGNS